MKSLASVPDHNGRKRSASTGLYYRIEVAPQERFIDFHTHDVGARAKRLSGQNTAGVWRTKSWLIQKEDAHVEGKELIIDAPEARELLGDFEGAIRHYKGDVYVMTHAGATTPVRRRPL